MKPFLSILIVIVSLFFVVFIQMEERRMGYMVLKLKKEHKMVMAEKRIKEIQLAKITRPQWLDDVAQNQFALRKTQANQIILMNQQGM